MFCIIQCKLKSAFQSLYLNFTLSIKYAVYAIQSYFQPCVLPFSKKIFYLWQGCWNSQTAKLLYTTSWQYVNYVRRVSDHMIFQSLYREMQTSGMFGSILGNYHGNVNIWNYRTENCKFIKCKQLIKYTMCTYMSICMYEGWSESSQKSAIKSHCFYHLQWKFIDINYHS